MGTLRIIKTRVALAIVCVVLVGLELRSPFETLPGEIFLLVFGEETRFARGYSDAAFGEISVGDSEEQVRELLGDGVWEHPHERDRPKEVILYSDSPGSTHYRQRALSFQNGHVDKIIAGVYVD